MAALRAAPNDPWVLANLGMFQSAAANPRVKVAKAIGLAGLGKVDDAKALLGPLHLVPRRHRTQLARVIAPFDPVTGLELLPREALASRAAFLIALGAVTEAEQLLNQLGAGRETGLLQAACSARKGANRRARIQVNGVFLADGLEAPFSETDEPLTLNGLNDVSLDTTDQTGDALVSVVLAVRDAANTLGMALDSLRGQTWRNVEILVVDDASTDGTADIIAEHARSDERVVPMRNTEVAGAYGARNTGIEAARGNYVTFHDADDWAHPRRIERQVAALDAGKVGSVCSHIRLNADGHLLAPRVFPLARINPILLMVQREVLVQWGGFDNVRLGGDSELLARIDALYGRDAVARIAEVLVIAGWSSSSLMGSPDTGLKGNGAALRVAYVEAWRLRHARGEFATEARQAASLAFAEKTWR